MLQELAAATGKRIVFYCAFGERSAMAVQAAQDAGLTTACHIQGGIDAWKKAALLGLTECAPGAAAAGGMSVPTADIVNSNAQKTPEHYARRFPGHIRN